MKAIVKLAQAAEAAESGFRFAGVDSSPAPSKSTESMCRVVELLGVNILGWDNRVLCVSHSIFKSLGDGCCDLVGFSGLMFAALEDEGWRRRREKQYTIGDLLVYSTRCGIGLTRFLFLGIPLQRRWPSLRRIVEHWHSA